MIVNYPAVDVKLGSMGKPLQNPHSSLIHGFEYSFSIQMYIDWHLLQFLYHQ